MNKKKRIFVIIILLFIGGILVFLTNMYENRFIFIKDKYNNYKKCIDYKDSNKDKYILYYNNNSINYCDCVTYVNIGLDKDFYNDVLEADTSYGNLILVNKYLKLNNTYKPQYIENIDSKYFIFGNIFVRGLVKDAKDSFEKLSQDSIKNGTPVYGQSAYRSYDYQTIIYKNAISNYNKKIADKDTARPGFSEHQTGLAIDVSSTKNGNMLNFFNSFSYKWMINNAYKYGFILRYTFSKEFVHGYINEPWHYRYVGIKISLDMHFNHDDLTFDEYYYRYIEKR